MKKILTIILLAIAIGGGIAYFIFNRKYTYEENLVNAQAFQVGVFTNYDNAKKVADRNNGIVIKDEEMYRVYVSILSSSEAVDKMRKYYDSIGLNYYLKEIEVPENFLTNIKDTEKILLDSDITTYNIINLSVLNKYKELI